MTLRELRKLSKQEIFYHYLFHGKQSCINCNWLEDFTCRNETHIAKLCLPKGTRFSYSLRVTFKNYPEDEKIFHVGSKCEDWELIFIG